MSIIVFDISSHACMARRPWPTCMLAYAMRLLHFSCPIHLTRGFFWIFLCVYFIQHCFICRPSDSTVSELRLRHWLSDALATRLDLIQLGYISSTLGYISSYTKFKSPSLRPAIKGSTQFLALVFAKKGGAVDSIAPSSANIRHSSHCYRNFVFEQYENSR
jgi:hypothetical protein